MATSWKDLWGHLPLDGRTRTWAAEKHGLYIQVPNSLERIGSILAVEPLPILGSGHTAKSRRVRVDRDVVRRVNYVSPEEEAGRARIREILRDQANLTPGSKPRPRRHNHGELRH